MILTMFKDSLLNLDTNLPKQAKLLDCVGLEFNLADSFLVFQDE